MLLSNAPLRMRQWNISGNAKMKYNSFVVGQNIRRLREEKHITIEEFAGALDKSTSHIHQMELGTRGMSLDLLFTIMNFFQVDSNTILGVGSNTDSIDAALGTLDVAKRNYLTGIITEMIAKMPA